ncbi:H(+)/Cl(-) exchange transporter ClcA [Thalassocella blandensis]|nr:H(+)/Cl(-) exchange transporter ClcA [Thalassocella blandensis]
MTNNTPNNRLKDWWNSSLRELRYSLSYIDALPQLTILGCIVGLLTGVIIVVFRLIIELPLGFWLQDAENFEQLSPAIRAGLILGGAILLGFAFLFIAPRYRDVSVSHVLDRMHNHQGKLPMRNWLVQFVGGALAMLSGQSVGREGPVTHLGAGAASMFAQWLRLPNNSIHILVGCGVAAAISASFNTPMAGVIFAMEVLAMEYTIVGFIPVILASVMGTMINQAALGNEGFIHLDDTNIGSLIELPVMVGIGGVIALCAGIYIKLNIFSARFERVPLLLRFTAAGLIAAAFSIFVPEIMGMGYDTVNAALAGKIAIYSVLLIAAAKLIVTPITVGLGIPGGLIGPLLVIGACIGSALGAIANFLFPTLGADPAFYVLIGMAAMMAATINAPLTALVTVLELTYNPNVIFPAMLAIVVACLVTRQLFKVKGLFIEQLENSKRHLDFAPAKQALRRVGVMSVMDSRFKISPQKISLEKAEKLLVSNPMWIVISDSDGRYSHAMHAADLANYLEKDEDDTETATAQEEIDLLEIPSRNFRVSAINDTATLLEAMQTFTNGTSEVLYVSRSRGAFAGDIQGILTRSAIENYYTPVEFRHVNAVD